MEHSPVRQDASSDDASEDCMHRAMASLSKPRDGDTRRWSTPIVPPPPHPSDDNSLAYLLNSVNEFVDGTSYYQSWLRDALKRGDTQGLVKCLGSLAEETTLWHSLATHGARHAAEVHRKRKAAAPPPPPPHPRPNKRARTG